MADDAATYSDEEFAELVGFLNDTKLEVQRFAAEGVLAQTESQAFLDYCRRQPRKVAKFLLRLAEKAEADAATSRAAALVAAGGGAVGEKAARQAAMEAAAASAAGSAALQALVNISTVPAVCEELLELSAVRRVCEAMRGGWLEGRSGLVHWYAMLLSNLTTSPKGQEAACTDDAMLRFLLAAFVTKQRPPPRDGYDDPLLFLGKVVGNVCALELGRRALAGGDQGTASATALAKELKDRARRPDVVAALRNLCLDVECHAALIGADVFAAMAPFLFPVSAERAALPEDVAAALAADGAALTGDGTVRFASAICILGLCRSADGRAYLRSRGAVEVIRAWRSEEADEETRNALDTSAPTLAEEGPAAEEAPEDTSTAGGAQVVGDAPPRVTQGPLPARDPAAGSGEGELVELFAGIED